MVLSETRGLMAFFDCPRGHRVAPETRVFSNTGLTWTVATSPRNRASQEPDGHRQEMVPGIERTLSQRRSSCLWFQIVGVIHTHNQNPQALRGEIATMLGTTPDHVIVHTHPGAGHYGRSNGGNSGAED